MALKKYSWAGVLVVLAGTSFWAGSEFQRAHYVDWCLDLGGGQNPEGHPICVIARDSAALELGPIRITEKDVVHVEVRFTEDEQALLDLKLRPEIASALAAFTAASIGDTLHIRVGGQLVNSVTIAEAVSGEQFVLALTKPQAKKLERLLGANVE